MEEKTEDEVVDMEGASSGSFIDDSDDEESSVPEIGEEVHLEVSYVDILFHPILCLLMIFFYSDKNLSVYTYFSDINFYCALFSFLCVSYRSH